MRVRSIAHGENSGTTTGEKLAVMVPAPLMVAVVDADVEFNMEIGDSKEMLQFWKL